jgi:hypothetical protein
MIFRYAYLGHKRLQLQRFLHGARNARQTQHASLLAKIYRNASSAYGRDHGFREIHNVGDFRTRQPIMSFEDVEPYVERVMRGDVTAMFSPETRVRMFAMSSGTTGRPKHLPLTDELFREYRVGWQIWGAGVYGDHIDLMWKKTLQLSSDWKQSSAPDGTPCGQISGLAAETRPLVARPIFLLPSCVNQVHNSEAKHYLTLRLALVKRLLGMMITANPSTLIELAKRADKHKEMLIRDIHDGTFSTDFSIPEPVRQRLAGRLRRGHPRRARELEKIVRDEGALLPKQVWPHLSVLAVWTGGSVGVYLPQVRQLYGDVAIRDHGLSASEGRITIPLTDGSSAGILDYRNHYFEFIPVDQHGTTNPTIIEGHELVEGCDYYVLLTTSGGLYRYDIQDVVRCVGFEGEAPLVEFLNKGKHFSNITGEKLSEYQAIDAVGRAFTELQLPMATFTLVPTMDQFQHKPRYLLLVEPEAHGGRAGELARHVQINLATNNLEYGEKSSSGRLLPVEVHEVSPGTWDALRADRTSARGNFEEYKHPCLVGRLNFLEELAEHFGQPRAAVARA